MALLMAQSVAQRRAQIGCSNGIILRVHDVRETVQALTVWQRTVDFKKEDNLTMTRKYFGTDGIRGRVGEAPITADFFLKLGWAAGTVLTRNAVGKKRVLIGKDTRVSGYMFESALEAGLIAAGVDVDMLGPMPTPAIAYLTRTFRAAAGIVISASHNAVEDNGIKFFGADGYKLSDRNRT